MSYQKLNIEKKLLLAPMTEITDKPFRSICRNYGAALTYTQMISAKGIVKREFATLRLAVFSKKELPIGVQLLGNDANIISESIKVIKEFQPSTFDLNAGCPVPKVVKLGFGAALLENQLELAKILRAMKKSAGEIPISVKLRLGLSKNRINENLKIAENEGVDFVIIHPKYAYEKSEIQPNYEILADIKSKFKIPIFANGFFFSAEECDSIINKNYVNGVMIARGALGNPFIFKQFEEIRKGEIASEVTIQRIFDVLIEHIRLIEIEYGENITGLNNAKKNTIWYFRKVNGIKYLVPNVLKVQSYSGLISVVKKHKEEIESGKFVSLGDANEINKMFLNRILFWLLKEKNESFE